jgi:two-component system, LytTR family, response regulator LytT
MKVLIIEDEIIAARHLQSMLQEIQSNIQVVAILDSIEASLNYFSENTNPDLIFLDIELGDGQSFDIFKKASIECPIIFTTAYQEHALKAFKLNSVDYLLKPVDKNELIAALDKYKKLHVEEKLKLQSNILAMLGSVEKSKKRFLAKAGTRLISVSCDLIAYFFTKQRLQYIKTFNGEEYILDKRLDEIEMEIDGSVFFRVNRQFILNYNSIKKTHTWFSGKLKVAVQPEAYEEIIISRLKAGEFKKWLGE